MADTDDDKEIRVNRMMDISPLVRRKIDTEMYRCNLETDEVTPETIQQEAFLLLVEDLSEVGLILSVSAGELYSDRAHLDDVLSVFEWISPTTLYTKMKDDAVLVERIGDLLSGGLVVGDSIFEAWLDFLGGEGNIPGYCEDLEDGVAYLKDKLIGNELFYQMLLGLYNKISDTRLTGDVDAQSHFDMHDIVSGIVQKFQGALDTVAHLTDLIPPEMVKKLEKRLTIGMVYLTQVDQVQTNAWLFTNSPAQLPAAQDGFYRAKREIFNVGWKFSSAYFVKRRLPINPVDLAGIFLYLYARSETYEIFTSRVRRVLDSPAVGCRDFGIALADAIGKCYDHQGDEA